MEEYPSNSISGRQEQQKKKVEKVISSEAKIHKKTFGEKVKGELIKGDVKTAGDYVRQEVLVPAFKKFLLEGLNTFFSMIINGESTKTYDRSGNSSRISYRQYYYDRRDDPRTEYVRTNYNYGEVEVPSRGEAEDILRRMDEMIENYGVVSVADMYEMAGIRSNYTDNDYGWKNIRSADIVQTRDGWLIRMPRAFPIKN